MHIYMSRHGESVNNTLNIIGGDCNITDKGKEYGKILGKYFRDIHIKLRILTILHSKYSLNRTANG